MKKNVAHDQNLSPSGTSPTKCSDSEDWRAELDRQAQETVESGEMPSLETVLRALLELQEEMRPKDPAARRRTN
jgi:hypothetical protein